MPWLSATPTPLSVPHDGVRPFNGTNPLAFAAPVRGQEPLSVDLATSAVAWNRLLLLQHMHRPHPGGVVVDAMAGYNRA